MSVYECMSVNACECVCMTHAHSKNLDNCHVFSMMPLQFSIINIFLFFQGGINSFTPTPQRSEKERKRGRESLL